MEKKIYWVGEANTNLIHTDPYWEKSMAIMHIEETLFPDTWEKLYKLGLRIKSKEIEI